MATDPPTTEVTSPTLGSAPTAPGDAATAPTGVGRATLPDDVDADRLAVPGPTPVDTGTLAQVAAGAHWNPHGILGAHIGEGGVTVRTLRPLATSVAAVLPGDLRVELAHEWDGIWTALLPVDSVTDYRIAVTYEGGP